MCLYTTKAGRIRRQNRPHYATELCNKKAQLFQRPARVWGHQTICSKSYAKRPDLRLAQRRGGGPAHASPLHANADQWAVPDARGFFGKAATSLFSHATAP